MKIIYGIALFFLFGVNVAHGGDYILRSKKFCAQSKPKKFCIRGNISYHKYSKVFELTGRVFSSTGPGSVQINFTGTGQDKKRKRTSMSFNVKGKTNEIIKQRHVVSWYDGEKWKFEKMYFTLNKNR